MQEDLFGVVDIDSVKKKKKDKLNIHLILHKVCIGSGKGYVCRSTPFSPNVLNRKHWAVRAAWKKAWEEEVWAVWQEEKKKWREYTFPLDFKAQIVISIFCIIKQDEDNAMASMKGIIDGIVAIKIVGDDAYKDVKIDIQFVPVKKKTLEHVEVHIRKYAK